MIGCVNENENVTRNINYKVNVSLKNFVLCISVIFCILCTASKLRLKKLNAVNLGITFHISRPINFINSFHLLNV